MVHTSLDIVSIPHRLCIFSKSDFAIAVIIFYLPQRSHHDCPCEVATSPAVAVVKLPRLPACADMYVNLARGD